MLDVVFGIVGYFIDLYVADERPEARSLTLGCAVIALLAVAGISVAVLLSR